MKTVLNKFKINYTKENVKTVLKNNIPLIGLVILVFVLTISSPFFLTKNNLLNVLRQASINGLISIGLFLVILTGGIDLSVGSTLAFSSMFMAIRIDNGMNSTLAILLALMIGAGIGAINGIIVSKGKVQAFIATLGTMMVFRGLTLFISDGLPVSNLGDGLIEFLGRGYVFGIPFPVILLVVSFVIVGLILSKTIFGKRIYAIGGNPKAAKLSGINIDKNLIIVFALSGFFAALSGVVLTSRVNSAVPTAGVSYELNAIAAIVIGGASLAGGKGKMRGTFIGVLIIAVLSNGLNLLGVSAYLQQVITGSIILFAVLSDRKS